MFSYRWLSRALAQLIQSEVDRLDMPLFPLPRVVADPPNEGQEAALPFLAAAPSDFDSGRSLESINFVTVAVRRSLRGHHPCPKPSTPNFRMFSDMPMDLVFEILPYLHPLDLFHFSRVTKQFRTLLHSKDADLLWRDVFSAEDDLPRCPPLMSTRHWVDFLFGAHVCEVCGGPGAVVDFDIWRRVCRLCIPRNVVKRIRGYDEYHELYSLMLCVGAGRTYITARDMRGLEFDSFWLADGLYVGQRYESLQEQGTEALDEFVRFRENLISESRQLCDICDRWKTHVRQQARDNYSQKLAKIFDEVRKRLLAEDIHPHDVELATHRGYNLFSSSPHLYLRTRLTSKLWRIVRPQFLIWVTEEQSARLERERSGLCDRRRRVVTAAAYTAIRGTASHVRYPPPYGYDLWAFMPFARVIYEDSNKEIFYESRPLSGEMFAFSTTMDAWNARTRADLAALLPRTTKRMHPDLMDRATSVFTCDAGCDNPTAIAWGEVRAHLGWCTKPSDMCFSPIGYWAARRLVELLGMDPQTTTDDDMDEADARFVCENCPVEQPDRLPGREVLRWRECVQHAVSCYYRHYTTYQTTHRAPRWALLSEMAAEDVCRRELRCDVGDDISLQAWACLLCQEHLPQSHDTYDEVVKHVRWEHYIRTPRAGVDLVFFLGERHEKRKPVVLAEGEHATKYQCTRCAEAMPDKLKLLSLRAISRHVPDKHKVKSAGEGDWTEFQQFVAATPAE